MVEFRTKMAGAVLILTCAAAAAAGPVTADQSAKPGDDFYGYANTAWLGATQLPDGVSRVDTSSMLRAKNARRVSDLIADIASTSDRGQPARPDIRKIADYYASRLDTAGIEARGFAPLSDDFAAIAAIADRHALATWLGRTVRLDDGSNQQTESLWGLWVHQDFHDPHHYAAHLVQGGLGLTEKDYFESDPEAVARRAGYKTRVANVLKAAGFDRSEARAARILDLETAIAMTHASRADTDDVFKTDNMWRRADFAAKAPGVDWTAYFSAAGLDAASRFVVWQPRAVVEGARLVATQPLDTWKDYLSFHLIDHYSEVLPKIAGEESGTPNAAAATEAVFGDAIGRMYVERYFPSRARTAATAMVGNIRAAFRARLTKSTWMSPSTRSKALAKLAALRIGLGYPQSWTDYSGLAVVRGDAFGNIRRAERFAYARELAKLARPVDPDEWPNQLHPQAVSAILGLSPNSMQFAAGLLQPPYFDPDGDAASNYGSAGAGIAHEISHSFDEIGNLYDAQGRLGLWWTKGDVARYRAITNPLVAQLDACSPLPGLFLRGKQVLAESASDLGGMMVAYDAYRLSLGGRSDTVENGLTGDQRFFIAFARRWRRQQTDVALRAQVKSDNHAAPQCRSNLVRNMDAWSRAFDVKSGDALYLAPEARIRIW
jgi:putative endopeptidase